MNTNRTRGALLGFLMVFAVLVVNSALTLINLRRLQWNNDRVDHSYQVLLELGTVLESVTAAEARQRGFLITGQPEYLEPYEQTVLTVRDEMQQLLRLTNADPQLQAEFTALQQAVDHRLELIRANVETREQEGPEAAQLMTGLGQGRESMEAVRDQIERMQRLEMARLADRESDTQRSY